MSNTRKWLLTAGAILLGSVLLSFLLGSQYPGRQEIFSVALAYMICITLALLAVHRLAVRKLDVFSFWQSWVLRSLFYVFATTFAILIGLVIQTAVLVPREQVAGIFVSTLLEGLVYLLTIPFTGASQPGILSQGAQRIAGLIFLLLIATGIAAVIFGYVELRWREIRDRQMIDSAELKALKAQIAPHFLFNTINTIVAVIQPDPARAEQLLIKLSALLRYQFRISGLNKVALGEELAFTRNYLELLQARFGKELEVEWNMECENDQLPVPPLILQPLIENAVKHGWRNNGEGLKIILSGKISDKKCIFEVEDNGRGIADPVRKKLPRPGHALSNISERLQLHYGKQGILSVSSQPGKYTKITLHIPGGS